MRLRAVLAAGLLLAPHVGAADNLAGVGAIHVLPLAEAAQAMGPGTSLAPPAAPSPRAAALAGALRARTGALRRRRAALRAARSAPLTSQQREALRALRARLGDAVQVRTGPRFGTPRQIRGRVLERAASERDPDLATARAFLRANRALLRIDDPDSELSLRRRQRDRLGKRHLRFDQRYQGLPVWPAELIVHLDARGNVELMTGVYVPTPRKLSRTPALTTQDAVRYARRAIRGPRAATASARAHELVVYAAEGRPRLVYRVDLPLSITEDWRVLVDARSGAIVRAYNRVAAESVAGSGLDLGGVSRPLDVWKDGSTYYMLDASKDMYDETSSPPAPDATRGAIVIGDSGNRPPSSDPMTLGDPVQVVASAPAGPWLADAVSAAHGLSTVYDYYEQRHARTSLDGQGGSILAFVRLGQDYFNAFFNPSGSFIAFGDAEPYAGALDVVAHELTHGVTSHSAGLEYVDQSGALNEAFSDIFGEAVQAFSTGSVDWIAGTFLGNLRSRNLADPSSVEICCGRSYPSKLSELLKPDDPVLGAQVIQDNGGVHLNSSIVNHAFYLLAAGLPGAIGIPDAERIFYRALTVYLVRFSQFVDARLACIQAAEDLFGGGSSQALRTAEAFDQVEIFGSTPTPEPRPFPGVANGEDSTLFLASSNGGFDLGRRESALGDPAVGTLVAADVVPMRPSVNGDGSIAAFVDGDNDMCLMLTALGFDPDLCLGVPGVVHSVAMSTSADVFGFVLRDAQGEPDNRILVIDLGVPEGDPDAQRVFELAAPTLDGGNIATVLYADAMDFTADERFLVYDALSQVSFAGASPILVWSIYAINRETGVTLNLVPPVLGLDIAFPSLSQTSDSFITFDAFDGVDSSIIAASLDTGDLGVVASVEGGFGVPGYTGDDGAIVYSQGDPLVPTGFSLYRQPLDPDRLTPVGASEPWLVDADLSAIYRRGTFIPEPWTLLLQLAAVATLAVLARRRWRRARA